MVKGHKKHMKRLAAPKVWQLAKLGGIWAPRAATGPHKIRECLPISLILRNRLKYSLTRKESLAIVKRRFVQVDGKVRTELNYPAGFMDVISLPKVGKAFRLLYSTTGQFVLHKVSEVEAGFKLCRVVKIGKAKKASIGVNPLATGKDAVIPYVVTHDGRTIRFADPLIKVNDTVKIDLATGKVVGHIKFETGNTVMVTKGHSIGCVGVITKVEKHPGAFDIVSVKDERGNVHTTRLANVFLIGQDNAAWVSLPADKGIKKSAIEARSEKLAKSA